MSPERVRDLVTSRAEEAIELRRRIHRRPELSGEEAETAALVVEKLRALGADVEYPFGPGHGVRGVIKGRSDGRVVLLRADMDALPVAEEPGLPFASERPGVMHACGHDAHVAVAYLAASALCSMRRELEGAIVLMFQPHEERLPGGARGMIEAGILREPRVDFALSIHTDPTFEVGEIGVRDGAMMARPDDFRVVVRGCGGHAARPHAARDPIVAASAVVLALQQLVSRRIDPVVPGVVSVCSIHGGASHNVIPETVELLGTARSLSPDVAAMFREEATRTAAAVAEGYGCAADVEWVEGYPPLLNSRSVNDVVRRVAPPFAKPVDVTEPLMGGEDFGYIAREVPATMIRLGSGAGDKATRRPWHHPGYLVDERAISIGAMVLVSAAIELLRRDG